MEAFYVEISLNGSGTMMEITGLHSIFSYIGAEGSYGKHAYDGIGVAKTLSPRG